jgi:hypothetical protein
MTGCSRKTEARPMAIDPVLMHLIIALSVMALAAHATRSR